MIREVQRLFLEPSPRQRHGRARGALVARWVIGGRRRYCAAGQKLDRPLTTEGGMPLAGRRLCAGICAALASGLCRSRFCQSAIS